MGHLSIAVIKRIVKNSKLGEPIYNYLVIKTKEHYQFYDVENTGIGSTFNFSEFQENIVSYFKIGSTNFEKITPFRFSINDNATAYDYILSSEQTTLIDERIKGDANLLWLEETQLLQFKNEWKQNQIFIFDPEKPFETSTFSNNLRTSIRNIVKARANGKLVIFAGAGVSIDSNVPDWEKLTTDLKADILCEEVDYLKISEQYSIQRGNKEYQERVREILNVEKTTYNPIHKKILEIQPIHIVTTNFDSHFEQIIEKNNFHYSVVKKDADLPYSKGNSLFIKMHGDFLEKNIVLKSSDYNTYSQNFRLIESYLKGLFSSKLVLFVGFSFTDPNLKQILKSVKDTLRSDNQQPYLFLANGAIDINSDRKSIEENVKILDYETGAINEYFNQIATPEDKDNIENLSVLGGSTYKFLKVVENFDLVGDALENLEVQDQLVLSLGRFKGLNSIPPTAFESISPFTLKKQSVFDFSNRAIYSSEYPLHLEILNENLLTFLDAKKKDDKINFFSYNNKSQTQKERNLDQALKFLFSSGVHCIIRKNDTSHIHHKLNPIGNNVKCNCYRCLHDGFKYSTLLSNLESAADRLICKNENEGTSLLEAYGFFKTSQPTKAFYALEKLKNEAWKTQDYVVYFVATYNQKLLYSFMDWHFDQRVDQQEFEQIKLKIRKINLDKLLLDLPIDEDVRIVLKSIADNKSFDFAKGRIENDYNKIHEVYNGYKKGNYFTMWGAVYWTRVEQEFFVLNNFYHSNFLYNDDFTYYKKLAQLYIESILVSVATSKKYPNHIGCCSKLFFKTFILHGNSKENEILLEKYGITNFEFSSEDSHRSFVLEAFNEYLNSGYTEHHFMGNSINKNEFLDASLSKSEYLKSTMLKIFNNFLLLLCRVGLEKEELNQALNKILNYLSVSPLFDGHNDLKYFEKFVVHHILKISNENIQKIVEYSLCDNIWSDKLIAPFANAIAKEKKLVNFLDEKTYIKIIRRAEPRQKWTTRISDMLPFYPLLKNEQQDKFYSLLESSLLNEKSNIVHIITAYRCGVWKPIAEDVFYKHFCKVILGDAEKIQEFAVDDEGTPQKFRSFAEYNSVCFAIKLIYWNDLFKSSFCQDLKTKVIPNMFKWILSPESYNYDLFDVRWLLNFSEKSMLSKLGKIPELKSKIEKDLKEKYNDKVAKIYFDFFCLNESKILEHDDFQ